METANFEHKRISNKLPIISAAVAIILFLGFLLMPEPHVKYHITADEMLKEAMSFEDVMTPDMLMDVIYSDDSTSIYRFIDLRSAHDYVNGHLPGAINIPVSKILSKEYTHIFNQDEHINVLYYTDQCGACGPWMILKQIGYKNNMVLQGGYTFAKAHVIDDFSPMNGEFKDEKAKYDYAKLMKRLSGSGSAKTEETNANAAPVIINNNSAPEEEGGC